MKIDSKVHVLNPENRRLLPNSANGTHIVEGPENRCNSFFDIDYTKILYSIIEAIKVMFYYICPLKHFRYYIGIIDIFTEYGLRQRVGRILKTMKFCNCNHSSAPPDIYASRFTSFIESKLDR